MIDYNRLPRNRMTSYGIYKFGGAEALATLKKFENDNYGTSWLELLLILAFGLFRDDEDELVIRGSSYLIPVICKGYQSL